ncbi:hypothetical protein [Phyllobacterium chamaecytisi]|uniref:hypothetical protein n=1 Tax=Phyllobacterium chamaecytisi TaxID=2876082 RepID=UPI001CC96BE5|nr:hypothetical protein [Phyllobacterium sp. KW56]MBZ9603319.1 hypothetical protein [Phyllobacterium sp. KW56]
MTSSQPYRIDLLGAVLICIVVLVIAPRAQASKIVSQLELSEPGGTYDVARIIVVGDGSFIAVGTKKTPSLGYTEYSDGYLQRFTRERVLWTRIFSGPGDSSFSSAVKLDQRTLVVAGSESPGRPISQNDLLPKQAILAKFNIEGGEFLGKLGFTRDTWRVRSDSFSDIILLRDGFIVVGASGQQPPNGIFGSTTTHPWILKLDKQGAIRHEEIIQAPDDPDLWDGSIGGISSLGNNRFAIAGMFATNSVERTYAWTKLLTAEVSSDGIASRVSVADTSDPDKIIHPLPIGAYRDHVIYIDNDSDNDRNVWLVSTCVGCTPEWQFDVHDFQYGPLSMSGEVLSNGDVALLLGFYHRQPISTLLGFVSGAGSMLATQTLVLVDAASSGAIAELPNGVILVVLSETSPYTMTNQQLRAFFVQR